MGLDNFSRGVNQDDIEQSRIDRSNRNNPPDYDAGQGDDYMDVFDDFNDGNSGGGTGGDSFDTFGQGGGFDNNFGTGFGQQAQQQQPQQKKAEDIAFEVMTQSGKGIWEFSKELTKASKGLTKRFWTMWSSTCIKVGIGEAIAGLVVRLFGIRLGGSFLVGGILVTAIGVLILMLNVDDVTPDMQEYVNTPNELTSQDNALAFDSGGVSDGSQENEFDDFNFEQEEEYDEENFPEEEMEEYEDFDFENVEVVEQEPEHPLSSDEALEKVEEIPVGMYTRQFLFDNYCRKLGNINPSFAVKKEIPEDSSDFDTLCYAVETAGRAFGLDDDKLPELKSAEETLFTINLVTTRVKGISHDKLANELVSIYKANEQDPKVKGSIFAISESVGTECRITIFTGKKPLVSLKDMYGACSDFILNSKHVIPVVVGINEAGIPVVADFKNIESVLVAGMPRTGKSWTVQSIMSQMCAFCSPKELHFYIGDPKDGISDFKSFCLPHVKKFVSGDDNIVKMLDDIIHVEAPRRKRLLGDAGVVNIWDFKEKHPDVELPLIYVVIDEVVTLAMRMEKDTKATFQAYLTELISQLPALGIRAFLIPHVIKNDIIAKKTTDLIQCRISVCGDAGHIEDCLGTKPNQFTFKLSGKGELAVKMPEVSADTLYVRSSILSTSNGENNDIFEFQRKLWRKIEPNCEDDSVSSSRDIDNKIDLLSETDVSSDDDDDFDLLSSMSYSENSAINREYNPRG